MKHRKEEDDLYRKFARQREQEEIKMKEEFRVRIADSINSHTDLICSPYIDMAVSIIKSFKWPLTTAVS